MTLTRPVPSASRLPARVLAGALSLLLLAPAAAREPPRAGAAAAATSPPVPLLWKVSDDDNSVYLLGSFHLLRPDDYPLSKDVDAAFADAEKLVFELPPEEMGSPQLGLQMAQAAMRTDGTTLDSELPPQTVAALAAWIEANAAALQPSGLTAQSMQLFEPWFAALMVAIVELQKQGLDPKLGLDAHLVGRAQQASKPVGGLETGAQQIAFLDGMDRAEQLQYLQESLEQAQPGNDDIRKLHAQWRAGDAEGLWSGMGAQMQRDYPALYRRINVERNDAWVPRVERKLREDGSDDTLLVVGALHLIGPDGVVEKLRAKGYEVERICSACAAGAR